MSSAPHTPDPVSLAIRSVVFCTTAGALIMTGFLLANRLVVRDVAQGGTPTLDQPAALLLILGVVFTVALPAALGWLVLAPLGSAYRRGGLAMAGGLGGLVASTVTVPVNELFGTPGLAGLLVVLLAGAALAWRRVRQWPTSG